EELEDWAIEPALALDAQGAAEFVQLPFLLPPSAPESSDDDEDVLGQLGSELTALAGESRLASLDRRADLVDRVLGILAAEGRSSVLLVGPNGVGKTTLVHEVARRIVTDRVPAVLAGREVWRIPANELIAGARYTGMWQDRARMLVAQARTGGAVLMMGDPVA